MARPQVTAAAEEAYASLGVFTTTDSQTDYHLLRYVAAIADLLQPVEDLIRDTDDGPGWSGVVDADRVPDEAIRWLGQFVGVQPLIGLDYEAQRIRLRETAGWKRGTPAALIGAARQRLTGTRQAILFERVGGDPYAVRLVTYASETPDPAAVEEAVRAQKPAGLVLTYDVSSGSTYGELGAEFATYTELDAALGTYRDQTLHPPTYPEM